MATSAPTGGAELPSGSPVPVEHRFAGLDRRTIGPALLVLAFAILLSIVLPAINAAVSYHDEIHAGDVVDLADGRLTFVPAPGWNLAEGALLGRTRSGVSTTSATQLVDGDADFSVKVGPFDGTPSSLLTRVNQIDGGHDDSRGAGASGARYTVMTADGAVGVAEGFTGLQTQGVIVAFVFEVPGAGRLGVQVVASGREDSLATRRNDIVAMIRSVRLRGAR
jgi:hypothetical protein